MRIAGWRRLVVCVPPVFLIALNGWRFIGLGSLMGYDEGFCQAGLHGPRGLGDIAMAVTASFVAARLAADDRLRFGRGFLVWNFFGIADFLLVVFLGTLYMWPGFAAPTSTSLMQQPPFALIPAFFVPFVAIAHITLLAQRRGAKEAKAA